MGRDAEPIRALLKKRVRLGTDAGKGVNGKGGDVERDDDIKKIMEKLLLEKTGNLYSERVIDYGTHPRNCGTLDRPDGYAKFTGPCGDTVEIFLRVRNDKILDIRYTTDGCMTSHAAGSAATEMARGKTLAGMSENQPGLDPGSSRGACRRIPGLRPSGSDHSSQGPAGFRRRKDPESMSRR